MGPNILAQLNLARDDFRNNRLEEAEEKLRQTLSLDPNNPYALTLLAGIRFRSQRSDEAAEIAEGVIRANGTHLDAVGLLAVIRKGQGRFKEAGDLFQNLVSLGQESVDLLTQLGLCRMESGDYIDAGIAFKRVVELDRNRAESYYNLGRALKMAGSSFETFATFKRAIQLNPQNHDSYVQLWEAMRLLLNWEEGLPLMEQGLRLNPDSPIMKVMLAVTFGKVGRKEEAERLFKAAAWADFNSALPYAHFLQEEGRFDESIPILEAAIKLSPIQGQAYFNLAMAKHYEYGGDSFNEILPKLVEEESLDTEQRMYLHYALAKSLDQAKNFEQAMKQYDLANAKAYSLYISDIEQPQTSAMDALQQIYIRELFERSTDLGSKSHTPIFIVGMIRTGTTLLDQILSSHHSISSAGEQPFWQIAAGRFNNKWLNEEPSERDIKDLEHAYLAAIRDAAGSFSRITDKMPTNFWHIGMMSLVFPRAKFIHTRRNPMDTVLSIYTTYLGRGTQFAYDQGNIVAYYEAYLQVMEFWRSVIPKDRMIEIDYEQLVTDKETMIRQLLDFVDLEFDPSCLEHDRSESHVSTPSLYTARQAVNAASVERWRKYEPWLGKLLALKDVSHPPKLA
ncbi:MAG TPA: sulfotransferase [Fimbriimonadaceae bacterium]|jgi:tetratricopeptide (TPR) repeat protein